MSSAAGGCAWPDALEVHEFLDISKTACADRRHRLMLHHVDLGAEICEQAFGARKDVAELVRQHVEEDLGRAATLADWLDGAEVGGLPAPIERRIGDGPAAVAGLVANRLHSSQADAVRQVTDLLFPPRVSIRSILHERFVSS
jgi:hypothetical protein